MKTREGIVKKVGLGIAGAAMLMACGDLLPEPQAPDELLSAPAQAIVYSDPDGPGPLPAGEARQQGRLVVDLLDEMTPEQVQAMAQEYQLRLSYNSPYSLCSALVLAEVPEERLASVMEALAQDERVEGVEPNYILSGIDGVYSGCSVDSSAEGSRLEPGSLNASNRPNDPLYKFQWHLEKINSPAAWTWSQGQGAVVAVVDTGVAWKAQQEALAVEDLAETKIVKGYDFVNRNDLALDDNCHGTHVAGTIAQSTNNEQGVAGVAPRAAIMPVKVLSARGFGSLADIADGIHFAADHKANVINMSLGGSLPSKILANAVRYADGKGTLVVCAAGNEKKDRPSYPAACAQSLAVSAVDYNGELTWYSNYGPAIDLAAPGGDTRADKNGDGMVDGVLQNTIAVMNPGQQGYFAFQGTSMASPHVAGVAALLVANGVTNPSALKRVLKNTASDCGPNGRQVGYGAGLVDAQAAVRRACFDYGLARLSCACAVFAIVVLTLWRRRSYAGIAVALPGVVVASSGLFFLPELLPMSFPHSSIITQGLPAWGLSVLGAGAHGNPLVYSCFIPVLLSLLVQDNRWLRYALAGLTAGFAGCLLFEAVMGTVYIHWVPGFLSGLWLLCNGLFAIFLAQVLAEDTIAAKADSASDLQ